jgi:hypothetical protein
MGPANRGWTIRRIEAKTTLFDSIAILVTGCPMYRIKDVRPLN